MPDNTECCGDNHVGPFQVRATDGRVIAECERREDAHAITRALNECGALAKMHREAKELSDSAKRAGVGVRALLDQCGAALRAAYAHADLLAACEAFVAADNHDGINLAFDMATRAIAKAKGGAA